MHSPPSRWRWQGCLRGLAAALALIVPAPLLACGTESDCALGDRAFRILLPDGSDPRGAVIFAHGYRGSAAGVMQNEGLMALADELNVAIVAAQGVDGVWNTPNNPGAASRDSDELAYIDALADTLEERWSIPAERVVVSGFSGGAMLVWNIACARGDRFAGFAPLSGTFWEPIPETCPTVPRNLMHFHGTEDEVVPMEGRAIRTTRQGNVHEAFDMLLAMSDYGASEVVVSGDLACARRDDSAGRLFGVCTYPGGHGYRPAFVEMAVEAFLPSDAG